MVLKDVWVDWLLLDFHHFEDWYFVKHISRPNPSRPKRLRLTLFHCWNCLKKETQI
jgi:hypothetical protein